MLSQNVLKSTFDMYFRFEFQISVDKPNAETICMHAAKLFTEAFV